MIHFTVKHNHNTNYVVLTETESGVYYSVPYDTQTFSSKDEYRHEVTFKGRLGKVSLVADNSVDGKFAYVDVIGRQYMCQGDYSYEVTKDFIDEVRKCIESGDFDESPTDSLILCLSRDTNGWQSTVYLHVGAELLFKSNNVIGLDILEHDKKVALRDSGTVVSVYSLRLGRQDGKFIQFRFGDDLSGYSIGLFYGECNREVTSGGNLFTYNFMRDCGNKRDTFLQRHVISFYKNVLNIGYRVSFELSKKDARELKRFLSGLC